MVELCCGSAGISKACSDSGFQTLALDVRPSAAAAVRVLKFDLLQPDAVGSLSQSYTRRMVPPNVKACENAKQLFSLHA